MSSASAGPQASAMLKASAKWGAGEVGKEQIPDPVCKVKYQPFRRLPQGGDTIGPGGKGTSQREKMYACHLHHTKRRALVEKFGPREGWEPFSQWHGDGDDTLPPAATKKINSHTHPRHTGNESMVQRELSDKLGDSARSTSGTASAGSVVDEMGAESTGKAGGKEFGRKRRKT